MSYRKGKRKRKIRNRVIKVPAAAESGDTYETRYSHNDSGARASKKTTPYTTKTGKNEQVIESCFLNVYRVIFRCGMCGIFVRSNKLG